MKPPRTPIKIRLQNPATPEAEAENPPAAESAPAREIQAAEPAPPIRSESPPPPPAPSRRRLGYWLTHTTTIVATGLSGLVLLAWNLGVRLPGERSHLTVYASTVFHMPDPTQTRTPLNPDAIAALRGVVREARAYLVQDQAQLVRLVSDAERLALEQGWRAEVSLESAVEGPEGMPRTARVPAHILLSDTGAPGPEPARPAYFRLLNLLHGLSALNKKIEIIDLNLMAGTEGLQSAELRLLIWSEILDATSAAK